MEVFTTFFEVTLCIATVVRHTKYRLRNEEQRHRKRITGYKCYLVETQYCKTIHIATLMVQCISGRALENTSAVLASADHRSPLPWARGLPAPTAKPYKTGTKP